QGVSLRRLPLESPSSAIAGLAPIHGESHEDGRMYLVTRECFVARLPSALSSAPRSRPAVLYSAVADGTPVPVPDVRLVLQSAYAPRRPGRCPILVRRSGPACTPALPPPADASRFRPRSSLGGSPVESTVRGPPTGWPVR